MIFILFSNVFSQPQVTLIYLPQGFIIDGLTGYGYNKPTLSTITTFNNSNPACIYDFENLNIGLSYQYETKINEAWIADIGHSRAYPFIPQSFGFVYHFDRFKFGFGISQIYNSEKDYGEMYGTIVWPDEDGYKEVVLYPERRELVFKNSATLAFNLENLKKIIPGNLIFGIQYSYNYLKYEQKYNNTYFSDIDEDIFASNFSIGIRYDYQKNKTPIARIGIYYDTETEFNKKKAYNDESVRFVGFIPGKFHLGFLFKCNPSFYFSGNLSVLFWENIDRKYSNKLNSSELSGTIGYRFNKSLNLSLGIFSTNQRYENNDSFFDLDRMNADYFFCGLVYTNSSFLFELVLADSHMLSDEWRKHTILKFGLGYEF